VAAAAYLPQGDAQAYPRRHPGRVLPQGLATLVLPFSALAVKQCTFIQQQKGITVLGGVLDVYLP